MAWRVSCGVWARVALRVLRCVIYHRSSQFTPASSVSDGSLVRVYTFPDRVMPPRTDYSKVSKTPRRPYEKERLDNEMKIVGEFGLKNKREVWRVQVMLAKMRKNARDLLTLDEKNPKRIFEGAALLRRCARLGLLDEDKRELDYVLAIKTQDIMARRLQTLVFKQNLAKSFHHARVLIRQRHIRYFARPHP